MKKLIKKGQGGITIGGKPLYGYYYSSAKVSPGQVDENGIQELAEIEVYRPDFYNDINENAPWLFDYIYKPGYHRRYPKALILTEEGRKLIEELRQEDEKRRANLSLSRKRSIVALWNAAGRPTVEVDKDAPISQYNRLTNHMTLKDKRDFIGEISHPIEHNYFQRGVFDSVPHAFKLLKNRISRHAQLALGKSDADIFEERKPEDDEYSTEYKYAPYSEELRTHDIVQELLSPFISRWDPRSIDLNSLSDAQKYLLYDNLRNKDESLYEKYEHLSEENEVAKKMAEKLKKEEK